ncbi:MULTISPECIES: glycosyl transferase family 1 [Flavobacteriaceae]|uniref:Glycosyl transferase family 1 n=2 Tax=Flavobacteriaceae TaxID=49546 RepID=A0A4Y8AX85_9FLAO|nr:MULTISPECIES: glycosyl transferase family 1 [Flavobacteriaceae]TEW77101.1 glycosyl transferase family 1 [Gramella jeungdoensis]GGK57857.1 glycosyl transferase family 1 [Lutibacter litoralis]
MRVLIITYYWPPAGGSGVQRWLKFVKYLRDFEIEPIVYTVENPKYPILDESLQKDIPKGVEVLKQPIFEPNNLLSFFGNKKTESAGFLNPNPSFFGKLLQYIRANYFIPDARKFWINPSVNYLKSYISNNNIDSIITTGPPHSMHLIGLKLKQQLGVKWIADFRDPWTEIDYFHQLPLSKKTINKHHFLEQEVLLNADKVLVVGSTMNKNYTKFNNNVVTITNGFDGEIITSETKLDSKFTITHIGLMNADRNPKMLWNVLTEIISENKDFSEDFILKLIGKVDSSVIEEIATNKLNKNVEIIDYVSHNNVIEFQKKSQVLLLLLNNVPSAKGIITGKIFEYLMVNRPILAVAPLDGDLAEILNKINAGKVISFEDKVSLKSTILEMYSKYKQGNLRIDSKNVEQFHRKELTKKLAEIIKNTVMSVKAEIN